MDRAIALLPPEIRPFFETYRTTIVEHAIDPDTYRTMGFAEEPPRHFLDMDAYGPSRLRRSRTTTTRRSPGTAADVRHQERRAAVAHAGNRGPPARRLQADDAVRA